MLSLTGLKKGTFIRLEGNPYQVVEYQHTQLGRGGAIVRTKIKNLITGAVITKTFKGNDKVEAARLDRLDAQYLYREKDQVFLMDAGTFETYALPISAVEEQLQWVAPGAPVVAFRIGDRVVGIDTPPKVVLTVTKTEPGARGDTTSAPLKTATVETGASVQVPLFIKQGDRIVINTREGTYDSRQK